MTDQTKAEPITPQRAAELFDEAVRSPARRQDALGEMFNGLAATMTAFYDAQHAAREAAKEARRNRPEAIAARKAAARRGWETRRAKAAEKARERDLDDRPVRTGPVCDVLDHDSRGSEVFCGLEPDHDGDHEAWGGHSWPREDWEDDESADTDPHHLITEGPLMPDTTRLTAGRLARIMQEAQDADGGPPGLVREFGIRAPGYVRELLTEVAALKAALTDACEFVSGDLALTNAEMSDLRELGHDEYHEECGRVYQAYFTRIVRAATEEDAG